MGKCGHTYKTTHTLWVSMAEILLPLTFSNISNDSAKSKPLLQICRMNLSISHQNSPSSLSVALCRQCRGSDFTIHRNVTLQQVTGFLLWLMVLEWIYIARWNGQIKMAPALCLHWFPVNATVSTLSMLLLQRQMKFMTPQKHIRYCNAPKQAEALLSPGDGGKTGKNLHPSFPINCTEQMLSKPMAADPSETDYDSLCITIMLRFNHNCFRFI